MIKAIFFDFDGVIVESVDIKTSAFAKLFEHEGQGIVKKVVDYHLNNTGISRYEKFKYIYKEILNRPLNEREFKALCDKFSRLVMNEVIRAPYVKGAKEFLENYLSRYSYFVLSATPQEEIEEILKRRNLSSFFRGIYGAPTKKSDAIKDILFKGELKPIQALYVGDAMSDYAAAQDNCVNFVARINNNNSKFSNLACPKIKDLRGLKEIIEGL